MDGRALARGEQLLATTIVNPPSSSRNLPTSAAQANTEVIDITFHPPVVHQAAGMVSVQLDVTVAEALAELTSRALAAGRPLQDLANDVVERRLRFER